MILIDNTCETVNTLNKVIGKLVESKTLLLHIGAEIEAERVDCLIDEIEHERDYMIATEFPVVTFKK